LKVQEKIEYVFYIIRNSEIIPSKFFKSLRGTDGLYEVRIQFGRSIYRIFCFFDEAGSVIVLNGIQKKSQKVAKKDINKAKKLRQEFYSEKDNPYER
jgi:phage-related protein